MAYGSGDNQVTIVGTALGGAEEFNITFAVLGDQVSIGDEVEAFCTDLAAAMSTEYSFTGFRKAHLFDDDVEVIEFDDPIVGADSSGPLPPQCAIAVSLRTSTNTRRGRGRFYVPAGTKGNLVTATGRVGSGAISTLLDAVSAFDTALDALDVHLGVNSRADQLVRQVTSVRIGDVYDTIRRRRDTMVEAYSSVTL